MVEKLRRVALIAALAAASLMTSAQPAFGCSCMVPVAEDLMETSDGAFVGTLIAEPSEPSGLIVSSDELVPWIFEIDVAYKGNLASPITVASSISGASCGLEMGEGHNASIFLRQVGDQWHSGLCERMDAEALLDGPFEPIPFGQSGDSGLATETSLARWALVVIVGGGAVGLGISAARRRRSAD